MKSLSPRRRGAALLAASLAALSSSSILFLSRNGGAIAHKDGIFGLIAGVSVGIIIVFIGKRREAC